MNPFRFYNHTDGGEGAGSQDGGTDPNAQEPKGGGEGAGSSQGAEDEGKSGENKPDVKTPSVEDQLKDLTGKNEYLSKKLGEQSRAATTSKDLARALRTDPQKTLSALVGKYGFKLADSEKNQPDMAKLFAEGSDEDRGNLVKQMREDIKSELREEMKAETGAIYDTLKEKEYPDWHDENLSATRDQLVLDHQLGNISTKELTHLAARGLATPEALEAAKKEGRDEYIDELQKKTGANIDDGGGQTGSGGGKEVDFADVAEELSTIF